MAKSFPDPAQSTNVIVSIAVARDIASGLIARGMPVVFEPYPEDNCMVTVRNESHKALCQELSYIETGFIKNGVASPLLASFVTDVEHLNISFDVSVWFTCAAEYDIFDLARCLFKCGRAATAVAAWTATINPEVKAVFDTIDSPRGRRGKLEVHIDADDALTWISQHRSYLLNEVQQVHYQAKRNAVAPKTKDVKAVYDIADRGWRTEEIRKAAGRREDGAGVLVIDDRQPSDMVWYAMTSRDAKDLAERLSALDGVTVEVIDRKDDA